MDGIIIIYSHMDEVTIDYPSPPPLTDEIIVDYLHTDEIIVDYPHIDEA
jgi:hypothetical protein